MSTEEKCNESLEPDSAFQLAFSTMRNRCKQLQARLALIEDENASLRLQFKINRESQLDYDDQNQQKKIEELQKQNSQLNYYIGIISSENEQLWIRLMNLLRKNEIYDTKTITVSIPTPKTILPYSLEKLDKDSRIAVELKDTDDSLENVSICRNIQMIKEDEIKKKNKKDLNFEWFTYSEDIFVNTDLLEHLQGHNHRLSLTERIILSQQHKLKSTREKLEMISRDEKCSCKKDVTKMKNQAEIQNISEHNFKESEATQTSMTDISLPSNVNNSDKKLLCPLCGMVYKESTAFDSFHEHVVNHFSLGIPDDFEIIN